MKRKAEESLSTTVTMETPKKIKKTKPVREPSYSTQQKNAIAEFTSVTQGDKTTAAKFLKQSNWNVGAAVNAFFNNPSGGSNPLRTSLSKTFDKYREKPKESPDEISMDGSQKLLQDLEIGLEDVGALVFFEIVQSPSLGAITREGWVDGWSEVGVDTLPKMRNVVLQRRSQLPTDREVFKNVYNHTFQLALQDRQKSLPVDTAMAFWQLLFTEPAFQWQTPSAPWLDWWTEFYQERVNKAVNKDLWKQTLNFAEQTVKDETLSFWNEESSWPSVIDEFVEWVKEEKRPGGGDAMEIS